MANSIALAEKFLPLMDEVYKTGSLTSMLDASNSEIQFLGANKVELFEMTMDGLGDYDRETGYKAGSVTGVWHPYTLSKDRAVSLHMDRQDNEETLGLAFGKLVNEFMRTQVIPEIDAYRFAAYTAGASAATKATGKTFAGAADIDAAETALLNAEAPEEGRILFVSPSAYATLKSSITRVLANENGVQRQIETFDNMPVVKVPQGRFYSAITLNSGASAFGFANSGVAVNFMIVCPGAVKNAVKQALPKIFTPDENQTADQWLFQYRLYHDAFVLNKKTNGIYVQTA